MFLCKKSRAGCESSAECIRRSRSQVHGAAPRRPGRGPPRFLNGCLIIISFLSKRLLELKFKKINKKRRIRFRSLALHGRDLLAELIQIRRPPRAPSPAAIRIHSCADTFFNYSFRVNPAHWVTALASSRRLFALAKI
ncbi:hypothetical protein EVAR_48476_1 [Eumeta japonica]|uniref:Uncharacterized protein n=1 Tax=Eumeta variegata TaxID=151549 RepID=A0A4C1XGJ3_EUMVA|nr:hypothetical protein EVAR_48476_1 [Eumeta japonica]